MTVLLAVPPTTYPAGQRTFNFSTPAPSQKYRVSFSFDQWTTDSVASIELYFGGTFWCGFTISKLTAGQEFDRHGNLISDRHIQTIKPAGAASGSVRVTLSAPVTTAITVERF